MIATERERQQNKNTLAWPVFNEVEGQTESWFTPSRALGIPKLLSTAGMRSWWRIIEQSKTQFPPEVGTLADLEIRSGGYKKFSSMDELIADLDQPE